MSLGRTRTHSAVLLGALAILLSIAAYYVIGRVITKLILDILLFGVAVVVCWTWFSAAVGALRGGARSAADKIILTVWGSWTALLVQRIYVLAITALTITEPDGTQLRPLWLSEGPISVLVVTVVLIAGTYAAYATVSEADVPIHERRSILVATFVGGLAVGILTTIAVIFGFTF